MHFVCLWQKLDGFAIEFTSVYRSPVRHCYGFSLLPAEVKSQRGNEIKPSVPDFSEKNGSGKEKYASLQFYCDARVLDQQNTLASTFGLMNNILSLSLLGYVLVCSCI